MNPCTLILIRHAKSDWNVPVGDRDRPLSPRGRRQAPATGQWLARHSPPIDRAILSPARRAVQTWELVSAALPAAPPMQVSETAYTFDGADLLGLVRALPAELSVAAVIGHNPAIEELAETLVGQWIRLPTSALAVIDLPSWEAAGGTGRLRYAGRPGDDDPTPRDSSDGSQKRPLL